MEVIFALVTIGIFCTHLSEEKIWAVSFQVWVLIYLLIVNTNIFYNYLVTFV